MFSEFKFVFVVIFREDAMNNLKKADEVLKNLKGATDAQTGAQTAIDQADREIQDAEQDLVQVCVVTHVNTVHILFRKKSTGTLKLFWVWFSHLHVIVRLLLGYK